MRYRAGLDVSQEDPSICILDERRRVVKEGKVDSEPETIAARLEVTGSCFERIGLAAVSLSPALQDGLGTAGFAVVRLDAGHLKAAASALPVRTARIDARDVAWALQAQSPTAGAAGSTGRGRESPATARRDRRRRPPVGRHAARGGRPVPPDAPPMVVETVLAVATGRCPILVGRDGGGPPPQPAGGGARPWSGPDARRDRRHGPPPGRRGRPRGPAYPFLRPPARLRAASAGSGPRWARGGRPASSAPR